MARLVNKRAQKMPLITVIGEGLTEQYYFRHIRSIFGYRYVLKPYFFGTTSLREMERKIIEIIEGNGIAICVFDSDVAKRNEAEKKKLNSLFKKYGNKASVVFCHSLPSIEYWFLLHYRNTNRAFRDADDVEHKLKSFIKNYKKDTKFLENERWVDGLCADRKLESAIERARKFSESGESYSNIYKAFDIFGH